MGEQGFPAGVFRQQFTRRVADAGVKGIIASLVYSDYLHRDVAGAVLLLEQRIH